MATSHPLEAHFVSSAHAHRYSTVVCHRPPVIEEDFNLRSFGPTLVDFLSRHQLLPLVQGFPLPNFQLVREFYVNFPDVSTASASLSEPVLIVRETLTPLNFTFISAALGLAPFPPGT